MQQQYHNYSDSDSAAHDSSTDYCFSFRRLQRDSEEIAVERNLICDGQCLQCRSSNSNRLHRATSALASIVDGDCVAADRNSVPEEVAAEFKLKTALLTMPMLLPERHLYQYLKLRCHCVAALAIAATTVSVDGVLGVMELA
ncbi:hypothetical protein PF008_g1091 [Phytophthora fragariae]|uniref:Uncharacterized protein n=1 Tax=Phytophthora fragariae TaxID=53985 RepID=A0A6G0SN52_9STRA|nr:hypothetical protein PF008_g1091 [Phytophthora fragariae]